MKKFRLSLLLLSLLLSVVGARAQSELTVYDGTATNGYVPIYGWYADAYLKSEFVIPADELSEMTNGTISSMTFYLSQPASDSWSTANFQVFLKEVDYTSISAFSGLDNATVVYEGSLDGTQSTMTIEFTTPYEYGGGNLLVGVYNTQQGAYKSVLFMGETVNGASISSYSYSSLDAITSGTQRDFIPKTTFEYTPGEAPSCIKPTGFTVSDVTNKSATLSWESDADTWEIGFVRDDDGSIYKEMEVDKNPYTLSLTASTSYTLRVRTVCDKDDKSDWSTPVTFTTEACEEEEKCLITYELTDDYGDGWNGNKINVVDDENGVVLDTWTISSGRTATGSLAVCPGRTLNFVWVAGSYAKECSFVIKDVNDDVIFEYEKSDTGPSAGVLTSYLVDCSESPCRTPSDFAASDLNYTTATLSWTENGESEEWIIYYMAEDDDDISTVTVTSNPYTLEGLQHGTTYYAMVAPTCNTDKVSDAISFTTPVACAMPTDVTVSNIQARSADISWTGTSDMYLIRYKVSGESDWTTQDADMEAATLSDLTPETTYQFQVQGDCGTFQSKWTTIATFTTLESCVTPTELAAEPTATSATISWEGESDNYNLRYREVSLDGMAMVTLKTDNVWGDGTGYQMLLDADANTYGTIIPATGSLTSSGDASASVYGEFEYKIPTNADGALTTTNMVCDKSVSILIPAGTYDWCITNPTPGSRMWIAAANGNVGGRQNDYVFEEGKTYEFHVSLDDSGNDRVDVTITTVSGSGDPTATEWTDVTDATSPYEITDLTPLIVYEVQVQGDCGKEQSKWNTAYFQTPTDCPVPFDIVVEPDVNTANVEWEGTNDSYNLQYRKAAYMDEIFSDGFESGIGNWTCVDCGSSNAYTNYPHTGSVGFIFVYNSTPPQYLISPALDGVTDGMKLEFYYAAFASNYPESFQVGYSSTTADIDAFTFGEEITTNVTSWQLFSEAIPAGTKYFCVKCTSNDKFYFLVDDFVVGAAIDAGDWTTIEDIEDVEYEITGLESGFDYELQVQGFCDKTETEWSEIVPFTTLIAVELLNDDIAEDVKNSDKLTELIGKNVKATFSGRTFFKDGKWNSLVLPFSLDEEQIANSPLAGATIKALYNTCNVTGTTVNIVFGPATSINSGSWYIFKWEGGEDIVNPVFKNVEIEYAVPYYAGSLDNGHFQVFGNFDSFEIDPKEDGCYTYYLTSEGDLKYSDKYRVLKTFRIFFRFTADNDAGALEFNLDFGDGDSTTGIVELDGTGRDNRAPEGYYNLQGVKYNGKPIQKGVYINNGHKVVVK